MMTAKIYIDYFEKELANEGNKRARLKKYMTSLFERLVELTSSISPETFWAVFPEILGIDAKLTLLLELISFDDFSNDEIIRIVETDYQTYFKELCGYDLNQETKPSIIFTVC
ncbi:hypothetical protein NGF69_16385 [Enterococcus casseliflavus]|nr:hypothetical protein [Enterococcus casseliflavus]